VGGAPTNAGFTHAFAVSAVVTGLAGAVALFIPSVGPRGASSALEDVGAASPLAEPAYGTEQF
jgi:hypothetical protein